MSRNKIAKTPPSCGIFLLLPLLQQQQNWLFLDGLLKSVLEADGIGVNDPSFRLILAFNLQ